MSSSRFPSLLLTLGGLAGLVAFLTQYDKAFPQAGVTLEVTRDEAQAAAETFVKQQGADLDGFHQATVFYGSTEELVFLERAVGLDSATAIAGRGVPIWMWQVRWFRPEAKEEWRVAVRLDGTIARFNHLIDEAAPGADLAVDSAQRIAEQFVRAQDWDLDRFTRVEASTEKQDHRTDHHFTWERIGSTIAPPGADSSAGTGSERLAVDINGDQVGVYRHFLRVPERFARELQQTLSLGTVIAIAALLLTFVLVLTALGVTIARQKQGDVDWRGGLSLAVLATVCFIGAGITSWPTLKFSYDTGIAWVAFVGGAMFAGLFAGAIYGLWTLFTYTAGETLGRETFARSLGGLVESARGRLLTPAVASASIKGYALGFLILGYLTVFYLFARRYLGAWMPAEGPHSDIFNNYAPFIAPLTISLVAAITEELTYRLFGISLIKRYLKSTALALLIPAVIWAFGHASYAVFPVYIRGVELTIGGLIFGIAFLRLGLLTCIVAHFVIDAVLIGMPLLASGNTTYIVAGVIVMGIALLPALLGLVAPKRPPPAAAVA